MRIPSQGLDRETLFRTLESYRAGDVTWRDGRTWAYVYDAGEEVEAVVKQAYTMFLSENALDPTAFPSLLRLENELVAMAASHLGGDGAVVGNFTSGGTESIFLAVKTAREWARHHRPQIGVPQIVVPETAHAAFHKAAHYLGVELVLTPVDPITFKADVAAMRAAITERSILLVGSAVSYAHCVVDPIAEIAALARERGLLCHVDGCMGGFMLPYFRRAGAEVPAFDFSVPGVTSMSMDYHKYAFAAKGASVILYRDKSLRRHQIYACAQWTGYTLANAVLQSTRSGGPMAAAWAVLHYVGDEGYLAIARTLREATRRLCEGIAAIPGLHLLGAPEMNLIAFGADGVDVFHVCDEMRARGWFVQPQFSFSCSKENIHLSVNPKSVRWIDAMLADLAASVEAARALPLSPVVALVQQALAAMDPAAPIDPAMMGPLMAALGIADGRLPERMAAVNQVLNALPPRVRETVLAEFMNDLYTAPPDPGAAA